MREITWLKAIEEPMMMRERRQAIVVVRMIETTGIDVRGSTCFFTPFLVLASGGERVVMQKRKLR